MPGRLLVNAVNQVHGPLGVVAFEFRLNPDREELRSQIALLDLVQIDMAFRDRRVLAKVKVFVQEALWRVRVGINDQGRLMDCRGGSALGSRYAAALAVFLCGLDVVRALSLKAGESMQANVLGFILWQFYQPAGSPHAILCNDLKPSRGSRPAGALPRLLPDPGHAGS